MRTYKQLHQYYINLGLSPLPIEPDANGYPSKSPCKLPGWKTNDPASYDLDFYEQLKNVNVGVRLGGVFHVADVDVDAVGILKIIQELVDENLPKSWRHGRKSKPMSHYVYKTDKDILAKKFTDPITKQSIIEFRCVEGAERLGQQTIFPGSQRWDAATATLEKVGFVKGYTPEDIPDPETVSADKLYKIVQIAAAIYLMAKSYPVEGGRHACNMAFAKVLHDGGIPVEAARDIVGRAYRHSKGYNHDLSKCWSDIQSVYTGTEQDKHLYGYPTLLQYIPRQVLEEVQALLGLVRKQSIYGLTEEGNGLRFVNKFSHRTKFDKERQLYFHYNGVVWAPDFKNHEVRQLGKTISHDIRNEAKALTPPIDAAELVAFEKRLAKMFTWADKSVTVTGVNALLTSASTEPDIQIPPNTWDTHPELLNCPNGTVNLFTGELRPHSDVDFLTQLCPTEYHPNASHPDWDLCLEVFSRQHPDLKSFLQQIVGYTMQGRKSEEYILLVLGPGGSGKSTFFDIISATCGSQYVKTMSPNSVVQAQRAGNAPSSDVARLEGARMVIAAEFERESKLNEAFLKMMSGNDTIVARGLYELTEREYKPVFQCWFQSNHRPRFDGNDTGNQRRYLELPFDNIIAEDPLSIFDPGLKLRLREDKEVHKAVLAWIVKGCMDWKRNGLTIPACVQDATKTLFAQNDILGDFMTECCIVGAVHKVSVNDFRRAYAAWCEQTEHKSLTDRVFNRVLKEKRFEYRQVWTDGKKPAFWFGVTLSQSGLRFLETTEDAADRIQGLYSKRKSNATLKVEEAEA